MILMKKAICAVFAAVLTMLSFYGCASRLEKYKLVDMPEDITVDAGGLSDELQTDHDVYFSVDYPLVASIPDKEVYVYDVNATGKFGIFVRYKKTLQYFGWQYLNATSTPEISMGDYGGDGKERLAISLLKSIGETNRNEDLHILEYSGGKLVNIIYSAEALESDAKGMVNIAPDKSGENIYRIYTALNEKTMDFSDKGELKGVYFTAVQDFTVGATIYGEVSIRFVFGDELTPVDLGAALKVEVLLKGDACIPVKPMIVINGE